MYSEEYIASKMRELREKQDRARSHHSRALTEIVNEFRALPRRRPTRRNRR